LLVADVPLGDGSVTTYARLGDWPMLVLALLALAIASLAPARAGDSPRLVGEPIS
jgi:apolipoprotein N-acyltransferase